MPLSLLTPFLLIFPGIATGMLLRYALYRFHRGKYLPSIRSILQRAILAFFNPLSFVFALWVLNTSDLSVFYRLPLVGLTALAAGYVWGIVGSSLMRLPPLQAGVWRSSASFTNIGNIGGITVFAIVGESGYALIPFYKLCEELWYYGVVFPAARADGERVRSTAQGRHPFAFLRDPFFLISITAVIIGMTLNVFNVERPPIIGRINSRMIPMTTFGLLISIGLSLHPGKIGPYINKALALSGIKFILTPAVVCLAAALLGITPSSSPMIFTVILILSAMPTAFLSLVAPALYGLDLDLANACWLVTTLSLILVIPGLWFLSTIIMT